MPIDDHPFDALRKQFEMEDLTISPVARAVSKFLSSVPLKWPVDKAVASINKHIADDSLDRIRLVLETCTQEILKHEKQLEELRQKVNVQESQKREEVSKDLLLDASRRAANTRSKERVKRIGIILANGIVEASPIDGDEIEEMMRVAMELSDRDIEFLGELIRIEGPLLATRDHIPRYDAHMKWEQGFWGNQTISDTDSIFSKLESYGLVARISPPNNQNILADYPNRYVLLKKGARFAELAKQSIT